MTLSLENTQHSQLYQPLVVFSDVGLLKKPQIKETLCVLGMPLITSPAPQKQSPTNIDTSATPTHSGPTDSWSNGSQNLPPSISSRAIEEKGTLWGQNIKMYAVPDEYMPYQILQL